MKLPNLTYEILLRKHLGEDINEKWYKWAIQMLDEGFETESLFEFTGLLMDKPYNQFELHILANTVFEDLSLSYEDEEELIKNYATIVSIRALKKEIDISSALMDLRTLFFRLDYSQSSNLLLDFFSLSCAKQDLETADFQHYWDNANKSNIDEICKNYLTEWVTNHPIN